MDSIRRHGLLHPVVVTDKNDSNSVADVELPDIKIFVLKEIEASLVKLIACSRSRSGRKHSKETFHRRRNCTD